LAERAKCLRDISKAEAKRFDDLWSGGQNKILGLDGKIKYTRELGYNCDDATCFEGPLTNTTYIKQKTAAARQQSRRYTEASHTNSLTMKVKDSCHQSMGDI
jgi:hypothetical protein